jgi:hypothetical protein
LTPVQHETLWAASGHVVGGVPAFAGVVSGVRTLDEPRLFVTSALVAETEPKTVLVLRLASLVIAALDTLAVAAIHVTSKAPATKDQAVSDAVLATQALVALGVGQAGEGIDTAFMAVPEVPRALTVMQSSGTRARSVLTDMVARAGWIATIRNALAAIARLTIGAVRAEPTAVVPLTAAFAGAFALAGGRLLLFLLLSLLGFGHMPGLAEECGQAATNKRGEKPAARPPCRREISGQYVEVMVVHDTPHARHARMSGDDHLGARSGTPAPHPILFAPPSPRIEKIPHFWGKPRRLQTLHSGHRIPDTGASSRWRPPGDSAGVLLQTGTPR